MFLLANVFFVTLLADFVSGFIHWVEDIYIKPGMRFFHQIAVDNALHHTQPRAFLKKNWWQSSWDIALLSLMLIVIAWWLDSLNWQVVLFAVLSTNANQIHKWSHQNSQEKPTWVKWLQDNHILQGARQHGKHHTGEKNTHYCVMTNLLNPVLERVHFWRRLEAVIHLLNQPLWKTKSPDLSAKAR